MTEAELPRDLDSSAQADRSTTNFRRMIWSCSLMMGTATLCLGMVVIFGWHSDNRTLIQVLPQFVPMQYNTALGFVVCGIGLVLHCLGLERSACVAVVVNLL